MRGTMPECSMNLHDAMWSSQKARKFRGSSAEAPQKLCGSCRIGLGIFGRSCLYGVQMLFKNPSSSTASVAMSTSNSTADVYESSFKGKHAQKASS